jgi:inward rectifier potassium channel
MAGDAPRRSRPNTIRLGDRVVTSWGMERHFWQNLYHLCLSARWPSFFAALALGFLALNLLFASLYLLGDQAIANLTPPGFRGAFFFSVETIATVGYGDMHPQTTYGHVVATIEIFVGIASMALMTGVVFARFSRPRALFLFARHPVVARLNGKRTLMIRTANGRQNYIIDAWAKLRLVRDEVSAEGLELRRVYDLALVRSEQPLFVLGWTLMHAIDESSPLHGEDAESLAAKAAGLILTMQGLDESTQQSMLARHNYSHADIRWNHRYVDIFRVDEQGRSHIDYGKFHDIETLAPPPG